MTKKTIIIIAIYSALLIALGAVLLFRRSQPETIKEEIVEVRLEDGVNSITVNRHGQVTIKTANKTIMQYWSQERVKELFGNLSNLETTTCLADGKYVLIINLANGQQRCNLSGYDILALEAIQELLTILDSVVAGDIGPTPTGSVGYRFTPTPTPFISYPTATPTPSGGGQTGEDPQKPFQCEFSEPEEGGEESFVISETVCSELID
ncbi:hypothetical protein KKD62_01210 [Patescibacteria group bacterium]|nr:hypothetical protein [Patescibacteria group bacterium]MBU1931430.1 hypothetical protein [Patescibacteria group bacterium]